MAAKILINEFIEQWRKVQEGRLWMGNHFQQKLEMISEDMAFTRPLPSLHSPAEIVAHLLAWRLDAIEKIKSGRGHLMEEHEANWPTNEELRKKTWKQLVNQYHASQNEIMFLLRDKNDDFLEETYEDQDFAGRFSYSFMLNGLLQHDVYHLGQLGIIIKLLEEQDS